MSFYGVEWNLTVDSYRFDAGYDRDAPCGLHQRSVYVCERIPIQRVPLESVSGRWLLDAYPHLAPVLTRPRSTRGDACHGEPYGRLLRIA